ncbi:MAG: protein translocase subunit SecF [Gemmatimonadaceae bacterium]|jgi:preprotein translocase subunit SecF|nr:protein translocase subunit SecF [Gemmatimonadaceae bacterium]
MRRIFHNTTYDFIKWWRVAAALTIGFIALGLGSFAITGGVNYSIEFTGGTLMQLEFKQAPGDAPLRQAMERAGFAGAEVQRFGSPTEYVVRVQQKEDRTAAGQGAETLANRMKAAVEGAFGAGNVTVRRTEAVSAKVGDELSRGAFIAMLLGSLITLIYLAIRFEWRFGVAAVLSTGHDILVTFAFIKLMHLEVSLTIVAAILTLLGYSMNDTIIIFDRVRENLRKGRKESLAAMLNRSINETLPRSILTHATTLAATMALLIFAGEVIRPFAWVMSFGVLVATFSSIYVASPLLLWIETKFPRAAAGAAAKRGQSLPPDVLATQPRPRVNKQQPAPAK